MIENQFDKKVQQIRTNNGPEFSLSEFYGSKGIIHQTSCVATPQQNARVERKHQHILNVARGLLFQANLPKKYWSYAVMHAVFLIIKVPSKVLAYSTAYEKLYGNVPDLFNLIKVFGSLCFMSTHAATKTKSDPRSHKCVFLGYKEGTKGYAMLDLNTLTIHLSQDAIFNELLFPYVTNSRTPLWKYIECNFTSQSTSLNNSNTATNLTSTTSLRSPKTQPDSPLATLTTTQSNSPPLSKP